MEEYPLSIYYKVGGYPEIEAQELGMLTVWMIERNRINSNYKLFFQKIWGGGYSNKA